MAKMYLSNEIFHVSHRTDNAQRTQNVADIMHKPGKNQLKTA